jgi:hypothetical protein
VAQPLGSAFWRLYAASAVSNLADGVTRVVLPLLAATLTRDPALVAGQTSLAFLPWLLVALPGTLAVTALTGTASLVVLYVVAFAVGVAGPVDDHRRLARRIGRTATLVVGAGTTGAVAFADNALVAGVLRRLLVVHRGLIAGVFDDEPQPDLTGRR